MSQHIGDMGSLETYESLGTAADHLLRLLRATPQAVACDLHPGYVSTAWARRFALDRGIPFVAVQHHEAHVAALLADHAALDRAIIGVCFDGTGYGRDGTIQGGEFFTVDRGTFRRAAHLAPFHLPGGDASIRHPWRTAIAVLHAAGMSAAGISATGNGTAGISANGIGAARISGADQLPPFAAAPAAARRLLETQLDALANQTGGQAATTSMGRLFDAVASLAGVRHSITYEAEAAMALEAIAETGCDPREPYAMPSLIPDGATTETSRSLAADASPPFRIDWRPAVAAIVEDVHAGVPPAGIADRFHRGVAAMIAAVCRKLRDDTGIATVGLTGGVFQNAVLVGLSVERLQADGFDVLLHERVPPNDGGIALGQAVIARRAFARRDT